MNQGGVFELAVAWAFIILRLAVFGALCWYAFYEYRRFSRKASERNGKEEEN